MDIPPKKLVVSLVLVFVLGVLFAVTNGWYVEEEGSALPVIVYGISFISLLVGASIVILFQWRINKAQLSRTLRILPAGERKVVSVLMEHGNALEQNRLVALTGLHKVKVSRLVRILETRGVVRKARQGNTNLIVLDF